MKTRIKYCQAKEVLGKTCGSILTERQANYCQVTRIPYLCFGHQGQYQLLKRTLK